MKFFKKYNFLFFFSKSYNWIILYLLYILVLTIYYNIVLNDSYQLQDEYYKIIYLHVPCAWLSILFYLILTINNLLFLILYHPLFIIVSKLIAQLGITITFITLVTGSLWGLPIWGTFWIWDLRLTSVLILFFLYSGYLMLIGNTKTFDIPALFILIGSLNLPLIKFSVNWWNTLHQTSTFNTNLVTINYSEILSIILVSLALCIYSYMIFNLLLRDTIIKLKEFNLKNNFKLI